jgi:hypothetical protein
MSRPRLASPERCIAVSLSPLLLCCLAAVLLCSCASNPSQGYSFSSTYPKNIKTVSVPVFDNYTFNPGLEVSLTEAVIKELQRSSGIRVTTGEAADSRLHGVITKVQMRRLTVEHTTALVQEEAVNVTVDFQWKDNHTGKTLVERKGFAAADTFFPSRPIAERIEVGQEAAIQRLARDIVSEMRSGW